MKWISFLPIVLAMMAEFASADVPPSYHLQHPLAWMHGLPVGEQPGWSKPYWFNLEINNGNIWNAPLTMIDKRNNNVYEFTADFEQNFAYFDFGAELARDLSMGVEIPVGLRGGGFMDTVIDEFHLLIGNYRFNRHIYPKDRNIFSVKTNGTEYYTSNRDMGDGIGNIKLKFKWWFWQWQGFDEGSCACGVSLSSQTKFPTQSDEYGNTTGGIDQTVLLNIGAPILYSSAVWFTAGYTWLSEYKAMKDWPRNKTSKMFELNLDLAFAEKWGVILTARAESPFLQRDNVDYYDTAVDPSVRADNRVASGWNGLLYWRGSESAGIRYRNLDGDQAQLLIVEDWGLGSHDSADGRYTNNAPDVSFVFQMNLSWE